MAFTQTFTEQWGGRGITHGKVGTYTSSGSFSIEEDILASQTDHPIDMVLDVSTIQLIYIVATSIMTLETNVAGAPVNTIVLAANKPYVWASDCTWTNLLADDVTALFVTTGVGQAGTLRIECLFDTTPP